MIPMSGVGPAGGASDGAAGGAGGCAGGGALVADTWGQHNGAAAKVMTFDGLGKKVCPGTLGKIKVC